MKLLLLQNWYIDNFGLLAVVLKNVVYIIKNKLYLRKYSSEVILHYAELQKFSIFINNKYFWSVVIKLSFPPSRKLIHYNFNFKKYIYNEKIGGIVRWEKKIEAIV